MGIDPHTESIQRARKLASDKEVSNVEFRAAQLEELPAEESFDLILAIDCIHDLRDPVGSLGQIRELLNPSGMFLWSEPVGSDEPMENRDPIRKLRANLSPYHCLTVSLASGGAGLGTLIGERGARSLGREAGFEDFEKLEIQNPMQQFFLLRK